MDRRAFLASGIALAAPEAPRQDDWQGVRRIVAVGDVHGDKDAFAAVLKMAGLIDAGERWCGGDAHLVQMGDIPARGPQSRQAYDMLMRLEKEAAAAGGKLHALIGNHDAGLIYGDLRSVLPEEYAEFKTADSGRLLDSAFEKELAALRAAGRLPADPGELAALKQSWFEQHPPGFVEHRQAFQPSGFYGSWIRSHNAVIRINDSLFVHGGISPKYVYNTRNAINLTIRRELADPDRLIPGMASDTQGPLWYRRLTESEDPALEPHVVKVLRMHQVRRMVTGHVVTRSAIIPRFGGRVVNVDIGLSRFFGRPPACLVLEPESRFVLHRGVRVALPGAGREQLVQYLKSIEAADEKPSPVSRLLDEMQSGRSQVD
jgi:hypothetical protein